MSFARRHPVILILALASAGLSLLAAFLDWQHFLQAWLLASITGLSIPLGAMGILMTHNLTGGGWGEPLRAPLKSVIATLPLMLLLFIPLLMASDYLFAWTAPADQLPEVVRRKQFYLNLPFFHGRFLVYCVAWLFLAFRLNTWRRERSRPSALSAGGLLLWGLTLTFFAFDWIMALEPTWYSDILGLIFISSAIIMAQSVMFLLAPGHDAAAKNVTGRRHDQANLWLTLVCFWIFVSFSQYIIIWSANLPHEITWYLHRSQGGWQWIALAMMVFCALVPFIALMFGRVKSSARLLALLAVLVLVGHLLEFAWMILPAYAPDQARFDLLQPLALVTVGALGLLLYHGHRGKSDKRGYGDG